MVAKAILASLVLALSHVGFVQEQQHGHDDRWYRRWEHMKESRISRQEGRKHWCRENFQECKDRMIKRLEVKEQRIRELKECVRSAQDFESMSGCKRVPLPSAPYVPPRAP